MRLRREAAGDYRTLDGQWRIAQPWMMDNGLERRWLLMSWDEEYGGWQALDDDYGTLREARAELVLEMGP